MAFRFLVLKSLTVLLSTGPLWTNASFAPYLVSGCEFSPHQGPKHTSDVLTNFPQPWAYTLAGRGNVTVETLWRVSPVFSPSSSHLWAEHEGVMSTGSLGTCREQSAVVGVLLRLPLWFPTNIFLILWRLYYFSFLTCAFTMPQSVGFLIFLFSFHPFSPWEGFMV